MSGLEEHLERGGSLVSACNPHLTGSFHFTYGCCASQPCMGNSQLGKMGFAFPAFIPLKRLNAFHRQTDRTPPVLCVEQGRINMEIWVVHSFSCPGLVKFHVSEADIFQTVNFEGG